MSTIYERRALADNTSAYLMSLAGEYLMVLDNTTIDLKKLERILNSGQYKARYRLFLLHPDETVNYEIPEEDIILDSGSYSENYESGQRRNLNISLVNENGKYTPSINTIWVHDKFRLDIGIESGEEVYWFPRGIYILNNPSATHSQSDRQISLALIDKFGLLEGKAGTLEATYEIPVDTDIEEAINGILSLDNGSGYKIDEQKIIYDRAFKGMKMPYTLSKDAGSTLGEMILEIGDILNAEVYYNSTGNLCFIDINETINDDNKPNLWIYQDSSCQIIDETANFDFESVVNEVHVVGDNIENELFWAYAKNENPESPICIQRIGRRIEYINDSNIYSDKLAADRASYELRKLGILKTTINISVPFNPMILVNNLISIEDEFFGLKRQKFLVQSISYNIGTNNSMSLTVSNISNFGDRQLSNVYSSPTGGGIIVDHGNE